MKNRSISTTEISFTATKIVIYDRNAIEPFSLRSCVQYEPKLSSAITRVGNIFMARLSYEISLHFGVLCTPRVHKTPIFELNSIKQVISLQCAFREHCHKLSLKISREPGCERGGGTATPNGTIRRRCRFRRRRRLRRRNVT